MRVLITRSLDQKSTFYRYMKGSGITPHGESLLRFQSVSFGDLPQADWVFFYSKKGIEHFFEQLGYIPNLRYATIGQSTGAYLQNQYGVTAEFVGTGHPEETAERFAEYAEYERVIFPRARVSQKSVQNLLEDRIQVEDLIVYDNVKRRTFAVPNCNILVFTSPLNAEAYFAKNSLYPFQKVVAIGNTTASKLRELGIHEFTVSESPSELKMAQSVLKIVKSQLTRIKGATNFLAFTSTETTNNPVPKRPKSRTSRRKRSFTI